MSERIPLLEKQTNLQNAPSGSTTYGTSNNQGDTKVQDAAQRQIKTGQTQVDRNWDYTVLGYKAALGVLILGTLPVSLPLILILLIVWYCSQPSSK
ncbi:MAG TPA: hypothetical protein VLG76_01975 [Rhabdochlamydiaceae bacterium]|nr:hypothetical protein [Rhabdochlamydiaceae bacterium]